MISGSPSVTSLQILEKGRLYGDALELLWSRRRRRLLLLNGKVYRVKNFDEALDLLQRFYDEMEKPAE